MCSALSTHCSFPFEREGVGWNYGQLLIPYVCQRIVKEWFKILYILPNISQLLFWLPTKAGLHAPRPQPQPPSFSIPLSHHAPGLLSLLVLRPWFKRHVTHLSSQNVPSLPRSLHQSLSIKRKTFSWSTCTLHWLILVLISLNCSVRFMIH